jgi:hypothetical protein
MEFYGIDEFMRYLKTKFDECERKHEWRALTGRNHVRSENDTFIFTDRTVYQIKSAEIAPRVFAAAGVEVGGPSPDMLELVKDGAPIPLSVASPSTNAQSIIMFGLQQYSSETTDLFRNEYYHAKQDQLEHDLEHKLRLLKERPEFRTSIRSLREDQEGYFA